MKTWSTAVMRVESGQRLLDWREPILVVDMVATDIVGDEIERWGMLGTPKIENRSLAALACQQAPGAPESLTPHPARDNRGTVDLREPNLRRVGSKTRRGNAVEVKGPVIQRDPGQQGSPVGGRVHPYDRESCRQTRKDVVAGLPRPAPSVGNEGEDSYIWKHRRGSDGRHSGERRHVFDTTLLRVTTRLQEP